MLQSPKHQNRQFFNCYKAVLERESYILHAESVVQDKDLLFEIFFS